MNEKYNTMQTWWFAVEDAQGSASLELRAFHTRNRKWTDTPVPEFEGEELAQRAQDKSTDVLKQ